VSGVEWSCGGCSIGVRNKGLLNAIFLVVVILCCAHVMTHHLVRGTVVSCSRSARLDY